MRRPWIEECSIVIYLHNYFNIHICVSVLQSAFTKMARIKIQGVLVTHGFVVHGFASHGFFRGFSSLVLTVHYLLLVVFSWSDQMIIIHNFWLLIVRLQNRPQYVYLAFATAPPKFLNVGRPWVHQSLNTKFAILFIPIGNSWLKCSKISLCFAFLAGKYVKKSTLKKFFPRFGVLVIKHSLLLTDFTPHGFSFPPKIREKQGLPVLSIMFQN